ncbi:sugar-binding protein [Paenibacillus sp. A14]|uniref:sugar-binding protein n=1 Tax=Paenibacillus sp. A14 TaxID=3119820 RepID=UPI002FE284D0
MTDRTLKRAISLVMIVVLWCTSLPLSVSAEESAIRIIHEPLTAVQASEGARVTATILSSLPVTASLHYRYGHGEDGGEFVSVPMAGNESRVFTAAVPPTPSAEHQTLHYYIEAVDTAGNRQATGYHDTFTDQDFTNEHWTQTPEQWSVVGDEEYPVMKAVAPNTRNFLTGIDTGGWRDYDVEFMGKYSSRTDGRGEFFFRSNEEGDFYSIEALFSQSSETVTLKLHYWDNTVYQRNLTANRTAFYDPAEWNHYRIQVRGDTFTLFVNGEPAISATDPANRYPAGGIGFRSQGVNMMVADVAVTHPVKVSGLGQLAISHTPAGEAQYNADVPVVFQVADTTAPVTAAVYYRYGNDSAEQSLSARQETEKTFTMLVPGSNRSEAVSYFITAQDDEGRTARFPESGVVTVPIGKLEPYASDFENVQVGAVPEGWNVRGDAKVAQLATGEKVLRLNGRVGQIFPTATLSAPMYQNIDNFIIKFRAKYERTSNQDYNVWRLRYRMDDDNNNYAMEWGTHNWRYFLMRKTELGGNYYLGTYNESLENRWVDYELRVSGITHELYINGAKVISVDDFDQLRMEKGRIQFGTVYGIDLMIDAVEVLPLKPSHIYNVEPAGNFTGIYGPDEQAGIHLHLAGGSEEHTYKVGYTVYRADGDRALVTSGEKEYPLDAYGLADEAIYFDLPSHLIGTYDVQVNLAIDGVPMDQMTKRMRMAIMREIPEKGEPDLDMASKFGFNTHYDLNWRDDLMDAVRKTGAKHHRSGLNLSEIFTGRYDSSGNPVFDYSKVDAYLSKINSFGLNHIPVFGFIQDTKKAASYEGLQLVEDFIYESVDRYQGKIRNYETPNEPELFTKPYIPYEVVQQWKRAYIAAKAADLDSVIIAGDHTSSVRSVLPEELSLGAYNYADAFSWHPYVYNAMPDGAIEAFVDDIGAMIDEYGGWKDYYLTEGGWPTAKGGYPNVSEEVQRDYIVRAFLIYLTRPEVRAWEYYNFKNDGTDENYYEVFWGITDVNGRPKLAYPAVGNMMTTLDQAEYVGRIDTGDNRERAYVFLKDGEPIVVAWRSVDHKDNPAEVPPTSVIRLNSDRDTVTVRDINGVERIEHVNGDSLGITVSSSPVYVMNPGEGVLLQAAAQAVEDSHLAVSADIAKLETPDNASVLDGLMQQLETIKSGLSAAFTSADPSVRANQTEQGIRDIYGLMSGMADEVQAGRLDRTKTFAALESLYYYAESVSKALIYLKASSGAGGGTPAYKERLENANQAYTAAKGEDNLLPVSTAALMRANRYGRLAEEHASRGNAAESDVYGLLAHEFAGTVQQIIAADKPVYVGVWLNVTPIQMTGEAGSPSAITGTVANDTAQEQQVKVRFQVPEGWDAIPELTADIGPHEVFEFDFPLSVPFGAAAGAYEPMVIVERAGEPVDAAKLDFRVEDTVQAEILPVSEDVRDLESITVQIKGTSNSPKSGKVKVLAPDGKELRPLSGDTFENLAKNQSVTMQFEWNYRTKSDYHEYINELIITEPDGQRILLREQVPLDFLLVRFSPQPPVIDGNLDDWKTAYPVHLRGAKRNQNGRYDPANLDAKAFGMWDDGNLYLAVEVKDNIHKSSEDAPNLWKNDSLQVAFDPLRDSTASYNNDDMEWGFARHDDGRHLANIFFSRSPNPNGNVSDGLPYRITRDEAAKTTYYETALPASMIHHLALAEGTEIGYNLAVNDADYQMGRDNFIQWTKGLADGKNPGAYDAFTLVKPEDGHETPEGEAKIKLKADKSIVEVGEETVLTVSAEEASDLYGMELEINYDSTLFEFKSMELMEPFREGGDHGDGFLMHSDLGGKLRIAASRLGGVRGIDGDADLLRIVFAARQQDGRTTLATDQVAVSNSMAGVSTGSDDAYPLSVADSFAITGSEPRSSALVAIAKAFGARDGEANYAPNLDMNKDGGVDIIDLAYVAIRILQAKKFAAFPTEAAL